MRCSNTRCHYNDDGYCGQPDYVIIGKDGTCEQMWVKSHTVTEKYIEFKKIADDAYKTFDDNPTQANSDAYGTALNNLRDFCIEVIDNVVQKHPEITNSITWEEEW